MQGGKWRRILIPGAIFFALVLAFATVRVKSQTTQDAVRVPSFLQANRCYRFTFPITGAPTWKVLEVGDAGWLKVEVDAGPAAAKREPAWVNTAQIITVREARCSE